MFSGKIYNGIWDKGNRVNEENMWESIGRLSECF